MRFTLSPLISHLHHYTNCCLGIAKQSKQYTKRKGYEAGRLATNPPTLIYLVTGAMVNEDEITQQN